MTVIILDLNTDTQMTHVIVSSPVVVCLPTSGVIQEEHPLNQLSEEPAQTHTNQFRLPGTLLARRAAATWQANCCGASEFHSSRIAC